ncbi:astacin-like [Paramacrobiotus metropolitanus]|uniref:astacin-like n=1 Tax=Paramacrobiotus metropolitanus TaxID=2943436 RepID=UPI0024456F38|nr:astacin-like [Paramacrobiotus metropolitanus]
MDVRQLYAGSKTLCVWRSLAAVFLATCLLIPHPRCFACPSSRQPTFPVPNDGMAVPSSQALYPNDVIWDDDIDMGYRRPVAGYLQEREYWPNNGKGIPYAFTGFSVEEKEIIENALRIIEWRTSYCITFKPHEKEREFISFQRKSAEHRGIVCASNIGHIPGKETRVWLHPQCLNSTGVIQHEVMHALGIFREHSRPDRDNYITVYPERMQAGMDSRNYGRV